MPALKIPRILWAALLVATAIFLVVVQVAPAPAPEPIPMLPAVLAVVALADAVASFLIPAMALRKALGAARVEVVEQAVADPNSVIPYRDAPKRRVFADANAATRAAVMAFQTPFILSLALSESIALFGFILGYLGHSKPVYLPFFVLSWILFLLRFPTRERVLGPLERAKGAVFP